jgi:hypothetical protein
MILALIDVSPADHDGRTNLIANLEHVQTITLEADGRLLLAMTDGTKLLAERTEGTCAVLNRACNGIQAQSRLTPPKAKDAPKDGPKADAKPEPVPPQSPPTPAPVPHAPPQRPAKTKE